MQTHIRVVMKQDKRSYGLRAVIATVFLSSLLMTNSVQGQEAAPPQQRDIKPPTASATAQPAKPPANRASAKSATRKPASMASLLHPNKSPLISFRILFMTGSALDPAGKEGVSYLTAALIANGGSRAMTYEQIVEAMYPMATGFGSQVDKEMTVFTGTTHIDNLDKYYSLINQMLLDPGFREDDFTRVKTDAINYLKVSLRGGNDEELGKEALYDMIYEGMPYGHNNAGTISSLEKLTVEDVREFYRANYTQANLVLGMAGGYPAAFPKKVEADFTKLPQGQASERKFDQPNLESGFKIEIIQRETRSTAISLGFPIDVTRADKDWPALAVVSSYFGQHRSSNSHLYQRLREVRGLNYGDYAYIEYFPRGMYQFQPDPNLGRKMQIFQIWIRPVPPVQGHFVLRAALWEYDKLVREGLTKEAFEATREFLTKYNNVLTSTQGAQLGYALDSRYYGIPDYNQYMREQLSKLTLEDVNRAIQRHLKSEKMRIVLVTKDAEALRNAIVNNKPSPITYNAAKAQDVMTEDKAIENYKINVKAEDVVVVPVDKIFQ